MALLVHNKTLLSYRPDKISALVKLCFWSGPYNLIITSSKENNRNVMVDVQNVYRKNRCIFDLMC